MHKPTTTHWHTVKRILRYLKGTSHFTFKKSQTELFTFKAYSNADSAGCSDDRRSTSGLCVYFGTSLLSLFVKKQSTVSRSSTESEYRSLAFAAAELASIHHLLNDLHIFLSQPPLLCDNQSTLSLSLTTNPIFHACTKHIEIDLSDIVCLTRI